MKNIKNKNGFTLVELLAVIVVLAIVMGIAAVAMTNILDNMRKNTFVADAEQFIEGAKSLVAADEVEIMLGGTPTHAPKCAATGNETTFPISDIKTEGMDDDKSPYGLNFNKTASKIKVTATPITAGDYTECKYTYAIYLTDDVYAIEGSTAGSFVNETDLSSTYVNPKKSS